MKILLLLRRVSDIMIIINVINISPAPTARPPALQRECITALTCSLGKSHVTQFAPIIIKHLPQLAALGMRPFINPLNRMFRVLHPINVPTNKEDHRQTALTVEQVIYTCKIYYQNLTYPFYFYKLLHRTQAAQDLSI